MLPNRVSWILPRSLFLALIVTTLTHLSEAADDLELPLRLFSPSKDLHLIFHFDPEGRPNFHIGRKETTVAFGTLGLEFLGSGHLDKNFKLIGAKRSTHDATYKIPVGKTSSARDHHEEVIVSLEEKAAPGRKLDIAFRAFDDGIAFRYQIPAQDGLADFTITDEHSLFTFPGNAKAKLLPLRNYTTPYEWYYDTKPLADVSTDQLIGLPLLLERPRAGELISDNRRHAPDTKPLYVAITEADLTDYAGLYLSRDLDSPGTLISKLSPLPGRQDRAKVIGKAPFHSPWRVIMVSERPGALIESDLVFHLNRPCAIADTSWIKPGKTTFPWWNHFVLEGVDFQPGVNTATMLHYIDFCAEQGIPYHSLDGLDIAWYGGPIHPKGPVDLTKAAPSIDLPAVLQHAKAKGVRLRLWMHWIPLKAQIDEAFAAYERWGIEGVMVDFMDRDDQEMVRFYHEMAEKAARHRLTLTLHGAYKPTGMERTWPNVLTYEAVLNQEYNKWQPPGVKGTPPAHNLDVAFTRLLAGPLDYHQGGMRNVLPEQYAFRDIAPPVQGTRAHQLAMYVIYQSHLPMLADYPQAYRGQPGWKFLVEVPCNWDETRVLHAELDRAIVIARRSGDTWYLGGMTAKEPVTLRLPTTFLAPGTYRAELHLDNPEAGPTALVTKEQPLTAQDTLEIPMPPSGGFAATIRRLGK